ncbi:helix-turn-helix transcriptional regulator [Streptomyces sp. NPDC058953]|uniref:helix-turn-helix transcriptional regulator n=1 Tax=unclassified Streptomyces TaxID=2593676 RepID=UPI0036B60B31
MTSHGGELGHPHSDGKLCEAGKSLYITALRTGRLSRLEAESTPCLYDLALLDPDPYDAQWLRPVAPTTALAQLIHPIEREIQDRRRRTVALTDALEPFLSITAQSSSVPDGITVLEGLNRINATLDQVTADCTEELLTVQPGSGRQPHSLEKALRRVQPLIERGVRMRTLYQHTARHHPATLSYMEKVGPSGVEVRTLEEIIDRLIIVDRKVAFIPASSDRLFALELRHKGIVDYLVGVFEQFWLHGLPWDEPISYGPDLNGVTGVQRSIAKLLVEGHVDEAIARRLGMNVRTCRAHIAKLGSSLGSGSRTQLGFLIAQSGILAHETQPTTPPTPPHPPSAAD